MNILKLAQLNKVNKNWWLHFIFSLLIILSFGATNWLYFVLYFNFCSWLLIWYERSGGTEIFFHLIIVFCASAPHLAQQQWSVERKHAHLSPKISRHKLNWNSGGILLFFLHAHAMTAWLCCPFCWTKTKFTTFRMDNCMFWFEKKILVHIILYFASSMLDAADDNWRHCQISVGPA